jgi:hypothetical protein
VVREKGRNKAFVYLLFMVSLVLVVASLFFAFGQKKPLQVEEVDIFFEVDDVEKVGVDIDGSLLTFGRTFPGGYGVRRFVNITNSYTFPIRVDVFLSESVASVIATDSNHIIEAGEKKKIEFRLGVPENFSLGNYKGKVRFEMYRLE